MFGRRLAYLAGTMLAIEMSGCGGPTVAEQHATAGAIAQQTATVKHATAIAIARETEIAVATVTAAAQAHATATEVKRISPSLTATAIVRDRARAAVQKTATARSLAQAISSNCPGVARVTHVLADEDAAYVLELTRYNAGNLDGADAADSRAGRDDVLFYRAASKLPVDLWMRYWNVNVDYGDSWKAIRKARAAMPSQAVIAKACGSASGSSGASTPSGSNAGIAVTDDGNPQWHTQYSQYFNATAPWSITYDVYDCDRPDGLSTGGLTVIPEDGSGNPVTGNFLALGPAGTHQGTFTFDTGGHVRLEVDTPCPDWSINVNP